MFIMRCIAVDDEPLALLQISKYIEKTSFLELIKTFRSAIDALDWLSNNSVDLIFADINMPDLNGIEFAKKLDNNGLLIFSTAYPQYALDGFKVNAIDYLLKPISYSDFLLSAQKAYKQFLLIKGNINNSTETIYVKSEYKTIPIKVNDIFYIESKSEYVRIFWENNNPVMSLGSLKSYLDKLSPSVFIRVHRSYIVNVNKIKKIERKQILMNNDKIVPIGDLYYKSLKNLSRFS